MPLVLDFTAALSKQTEVSGGKGANLALLTQRGFAVPPGFIVSALAYRDFMADAATTLEALDAFDFASPARLNEQARALRDELSKLPLPAQVVDEVRALHAGFPAGTAFS